MRDADAQPEASPGNLVHERRTLREVADGAGVDRRDGSAERHALRIPRQSLAQRHIPKHRRREDPGEAATFDLLRKLNRQAAAAGDGYQADGG